MEINTNNVTPDIRILKDMEKVVYDAEWMKDAPDQILYKMYRGVEEHNNLRYDITVIPPFMMGTEFVKTKGHYHVGAYQEVYTVLEGEAFFLFQKRKEGKEDEIVDAYVVPCKKGDVVVIPSDYGHVSINPSSDTALTMANWISNECQSDYSLFEKLQGACYYYINSGWVKNPHYKHVPELRIEQPLKTIPEDLEFLKNT